MNQPSAFQVQYPLNKSKKFWKKTIARSFLNLPYIFVLSLLGGMVVQFFVITLNMSNNLIHPINFIVTDITIFLTLIIVSILICFIYYKAYINRYYYDCGQDFITIKKGVFAPSEIHVQYQKIQDVYVDQDIMDRMFGLYDVHIASATVTSGIEAHIDGVNAEVAENLKNIILSKIKNGGNGPTSPQPVAQNTQTEQPVQFQSDKTISSNTYPMSPSWIYAAISDAVLFGLVFTFIFAFVSFGFVTNGWHHINDPLINLGFLALCDLLLFIILFMLNLIYTSIWKKNYYFELTADYILLRTGVLKKEEKHMPYKSIQNITNGQDIPDRIFGMSDIVIENAATKTIGWGRNRQTIQDNMSFVWQPKDKAEELTNVLNNIVGKINPQSSRSMGL